MLTGEVGGGGIKALLALREMSCVVTSCNPGSGPRVGELVVTVVTLAPGPGVENLFYLVAASCLPGSTWRTSSTSWSSRQHPPDGGGWPPWLGA